MSCASSRSASPAAITCARSPSRKPPPMCATACAWPARPRTSSRPRPCAKCTGAPAACRASSTWCVIAPCSAPIRRTVTRSVPPSSGAARWKCSGGSCGRGGCPGASARRPRSWWCAAHWPPGTMVPGRTRQSPCRRGGRLPRRSPATRHRPPPPPRPLPCACWPGTPPTPRPMRPLVSCSVPGRALHCRHRRSMHAGRGAGTGVLRPERLDCAAAWLYNRPAILMPTDDADGAQSASC